MEHNNTYYDINENPNIFPPSRSYIPQTQIRGDIDIGGMNRQFRNIAYQQQQNQDDAFFSGLNRNNSVDSNFVMASSTPVVGGVHQLSYANTPSTNNGAPTMFDEERSMQEQQSSNYNSCLGVYHDTTESFNTGDGTFKNNDNRSTNDSVGGVGAIGNATLQMNELNNHAMTNMAYPHVYMPQPFYQLPQKNLITDPDPNFLSIDSQDRDRTKYPNPNDYTIPLVSSNTNGQGDVPGRRYKNIVEFELISAIIPNRANVMDEIYLILDIPELNDSTYDASNPHLRTGFAKLLFETVDGTSKWLRLDVDNSDPLRKVFYPSPKSSLDRVTIRILKRDGTPFNFGTDNTLPTEPNGDLQNSWTFRVIEKVVDATPIGHRNI